MLSGNYLMSVVKAVAPSVGEWLLPKLCGMEITSPRDSSTVESEWVTVSGKYKWVLGLRFVLFYQDGHNFFPQGQPELNRTRREWEKKVHVGKDPNKEHKIVVAAVSDELQYLIDHYYRLGEAKGIWFPIELYKLPKGLTILHTVAVKVKEPAGG